MAAANLSAKTRMRRERSGSGRLGSSLLRGGSPALTAALVLIGWEAIARLGNYQEFVLPRPGVVIERARDMLADGTLITNSWVTLQEAGIGFAIALVIALPLGYLIAHV
ncbi:MAG: ABC transporter permease, partial [Chloroflexota bacterium]